MKIDDLQHKLQLELLGYGEGEKIFYRSIAPTGNGNASNGSRIFPYVLKTHNDEKGLYFVVNGGGHKDAEVKTGKALFCEWDDRPLEEQQTLWKTKGFLEPTFQVKTRKSIHCYWVFESPIHIEDWRILQTNLLNLLDADRTLKNPSRVLRVAGSWHIKPGHEPVQCEMIFYRPENRYTQAEIEQALQALEPKPETKPIPKAVADLVETAVRFSHDAAPPIPLIQCLSLEHRRMVEQGAVSNRNAQGAALVRDLIGAENWLRANGVPYSEDAELLFRDYCLKCDPTDWTEREWDKILKKAQGSNPTPCLSEDKLQNCVNAWARKFGPAVATTRPLKPPAQWDDSDKPGREREMEEDPDLLFNQKALEAIWGGEKILVVEEQFYRWNGQFFELSPKEAEERRAIAWAENYSVWDKQAGRYVYRYANPTSITKIIDWAILKFKVNRDTLNKEGLNLANGVLLFRFSRRSVEWALVPHDPKYRFTYCSPVRYDPQANGKGADQLLQALDDAPRDVFLKSLAASLDLNAVRKRLGRLRACICLGAGSNGKDALKKATSLIFTNNQMTSADLSDFNSYDTGRKFTLAKLRGARLNWPSENNNNSNLDRCNSLNIAITGEELYYEKKGQDEEPFQAQCVHFFSMNQLPSSKSGLDSIKERFTILEFSKTFKGKPKLERGELQADPRFLYDPEWVTETVCPGFLNKILDALNRLFAEGIDYEPIQGAFDQIQEESTHLWAFCHEVGLHADADGLAYVGDLWELLQTWYIANGTLEVIDLGDGKTKRVWNEQASQYDRNITGPNQVYKRLKLLFPKIVKKIETQDPKRKGQSCLLGISFKDSASPASPSLTEPVSGSPLGSPLPHLSLSDSLLEKKEKKEALRGVFDSGEADGGAKSEADGGAESLAISSGEAGEAKTLNSNAAGHWHEKNGQKLTPGLWVWVVDWEDCQLDRKVGEYWEAKTKGGATLQISPDSITHIWN